MLNEEQSRWKQVEVGTQMEVEARIHLVTAPRQHVGDVALGRATKELLHRFKMMKEDYKKKYGAVYESREKLDDLLDLLYQPQLWFPTPPPTIQEIRSTDEAGPLQTLQSQNVVVKDHRPMEEEDCMRAASHTIHSTPSTEVVLSSQLEASQAD